MSRTSFVRGATTRKANENVAANTNPVLSGVGMRTAIQLSMFTNLVELELFECPPSCVTDFHFLRTRLTVRVAACCPNGFGLMWRRKPDLCFCILLLDVVEHRG